MNLIHLKKTSIGIFSGVLLFILFYMTSNRNTVNHQKINKINLRRLLNIAIKAAENGGREVVRSKDTIEIKRKGLTNEGLIDSVTTADFLSHCAMLETLRHSYSSLKIISEETTTFCDHNQYIDLNLPNSVDESILDEFVEEQHLTVWIDPLDATYEYTEKLYNYVTVMVCVAVKGKPVIGVIHKPFLKNTSWAWVNKTKSRDLRQVTRNKEEIQKIIISRSHRGKLEEILHKNFNTKIEVVIAAGAGYKALEVAKGKADVYLHITTIKKWDVCAGNAILNSLGGKMTTKYHEEIDYSDSKNVRIENGIIATINNDNVFLGKL